MVYSSPRCITAFALHAKLPNLIKHCYSMTSQVYHVLRMRSYSRARVLEGECEYVQLGAQIIRGHRLKRS